MNGSAYNNDGFVDAASVEPYFTYGDLKLQQQLAKQQFGSQLAGQNYSTGPNDLNSDLSGVYNDPQRLAELEKLSSEYSPKYTVLQSIRPTWGQRVYRTGNKHLISLKGPLVGDLKSTRELMAEFQNADPIYVAKTSALYPVYTHYRKIRGDGNCAWTAIAFGYFELLLRTGSVELINRELARLASLENLFKITGIERYIYEDFAQETIEVFKLVVSLCDSPDGVPELVNYFNKGVGMDIGTCIDSVIAYFKMLTSAWMKTRPQEYEAYLEIPLLAYCSTIIEPHNIELDHVGVKALLDCLILPSELGLRAEISYLDRSAGAEVNVHSFENTNGLFTSTLRLLYRPGHYDIIYKAGDIRGTSPVLDKTPISPVQVSFMPQLPDQYFASTPLNYFLGPGSTSVTERRNEDRDKFRASLFQYPPFQPSPLPFQTSIFRNSAYNPSHYQSENFQPELYQPELQGSSSRGEGGSRRRL